MNEGMVAFMIVVLLWGIFGFICSASCAIFTLKNAKTTWFKVAGWVLVANLALTLLGIILRG